MRPNMARLVTRRMLSLALVCFICAGESAHAHREYKSEIQRFAQRDPLGTSVGMTPAVSIMQGRQRPVVGAFPSFPRRSLGRFASPIALSSAIVGPHRYAAFAGRPTSLSDPSGLITIGDVCRWLGICFDCGWGGALHSDAWFSMRCFSDTIWSPHACPPIDFHHDWISPVVGADDDCCCSYGFWESIGHGLVDVFPYYCTVAWDQTVQAWKWVCSLWG